MQGLTSPDLPSHAAYILGIGKNGRNGSPRGEKVLVSRARDPYIYMCVHLQVPFHTGDSKLSREKRSNIYTPTRAHRTMGVHTRFFSSRGALPRFCKRERERER